MCFVFLLFPNHPIILIVCLFICLFVCHRYSMAGDICIIKVFLNSCDYPPLNPIRIILDELTAANGLMEVCIFIVKISEATRLLFFF